MSFLMVALVFEDERCIVCPDRVDKSGEQREIDGEEITRIISARRADKNDVRRYQGQEMD